jgi:transposase
MSVSFARPPPGGKGAVMQILYSRCCGIDVHKDSVTACVLVYSGSPEPDVRKKEFATHTQALGLLRLWLFAQKVTHVVMESTGVYWKPVWQALEGHFQLVLANPFQVKNIPGRKTDARDSQWLAELLAHGLVRPSFVPPRPTRDLRDLTRYRVKLTEERNRVHNRIHKVLEDACLKLDTVASDILGATGRAIIQAVIAGQEHPDWLADKAKGRLRGKRPDLRLALRGHITDHHRFMLRELMDDLQFIEGKIERLEKAIAPQAEMDKLTLLATIPGVDLITAWTLLAELGSDMQVFSSPKHAASWAGLCPGNHESGGKRLSNRTRKGNRWLRRALCQSAWAATRKKNCYVAAFFYRKAGKHGIRKAIVATAHKLLLIAFCILRDGVPYQEAGGDYFDQLHPERTRNRLVRRLQRLGLNVVLTPHPSSPPLSAPSQLRKTGRPCKCAQRLIPCKHAI